MDPSFTLSQESLLKDLDNTRPILDKELGVSRSQRVSRYMSISYESSYMGFEPEDDLQKLLLLRQVPMLPAFGDIALAKFSVNYFLYMEFFHIIIRMLIGLFIFTGVLALSYEIVKSHVSGADNYELSVQMGVGILAGFLVMWMQKGENRRLTRHYLLDDSQWSENLFCLLVEGLPENITKEEIKDYFQNIITSEHGIGKVKEVSLLQNVYDYKVIKKEHSDVRKRLRRLTLMKKVTDKSKEKEEQTEKEIDMLYSRKKTLKTKKTNIKAKFSSFEYFQGKAIVVFDKIGAQVVVNNYFNSSYFKTKAISLFGRWLKKYQLKGKKLTVSELPEPQNLIFENLDYPKSRVRIREIIVTIASLGVIVGVFFSVFQLELDHSMDEEGEGNDNSSDGDGSDDENSGVDITPVSVLASYGFSIGIVVLDYLLEKLYLFVRGFLIYTSVLEADLHIVNYQIYISVLLFVGVPLVSGLGGTNYWFIQLTRLITIYFVRKFLSRSFAIFMTHKRFHGARKAISKGKLAPVVEYFEKDFGEFPFIDGNAEMMPLIFIAFTFYMVSPYILLPVLIVCLYFLALVDKYRMTRCCDLFVTKSPVYTLNAFKIYRFAPHFVWWGGFLAVALTNLDSINEVFLDSVLLVVSIGYLFVLAWSLLWWPNLLQSKIKRRFVERNRKVDYDSVKSEFVAFFMRQRIDLSEAQKSSSF